MKVAEKYKQTEVGLIPSDWEVKWLGEIATCYSGGTPNTSIREYYNGNINWISSSELNKGRIFQTDEFISELGLNNSSAKLVPSETFLLAMYGATAGVSAITYVEGAINQAVLAIVPKDTNSEFLFQYFRLNKEKIIKTYTQGGQPNLSGTIVKSISIPLPPTKSEQTAIATALSDADALISSLEKFIAKKRMIKQGAMQQLLQPKEGWEVKILGESSEIARGGSPRPIEDYLTTQPDGINWIKIGDVGKGAKYIETTEEKIKPEGISRSRYIKEGDFLLSNSMSFGRPYILKINGCIHDGWLVIQNYNDNFDSDFLYYVLSSEFVLNQYKAMASGSSVLNLNKEIVKKVKINCPKSKEEQTRIATILSDMDAEIAALEAKLEKYRKVKLGMMQNLLTGKIRMV